MLKEIYIYTDTHTHLLIYVPELHMQELRVGLQLNLFCISVIQYYVDKYLKSCDHFVEDSHTLLVLVSRAHN